MNLSFLRRWLPLLIISVFASAQDVTFYSITKQRRYEQLTAGTPTSRNLPYRFSTSVNIRPGGLTGGSLRLPGGSVQALQPDGDDSWRIKADYLTQAELDAAFPNGTNTLTLNTAHDGLKVIGLPLTGDAYPNIPQVLNFTEAQSVNPAAAFIVSWSAFIGGTSNDYVQLSVSTTEGDEVFNTGSPGQPGALNGTATFGTIPAGALAAGTGYNVEVFFGRFVTSDSASYGQGVLGVAAYTSESRCTLVTTATATGPDVTFYGAVKGRGYVQTGAAVPIPSGQPYIFYAFANALPGRLTGATIQVPGGTTQPLQENGNNWNIFAGRSTQTALDADFPNGNFTLTLHTVHDGTKTISLPLTGNAYPNAPQIANFAGAQAVDPGIDFFVAWNPFIDGTALDFVRLQVKDGNGNTVFTTPEGTEAGFLTGTATGVTIPAGALAANTTYSARLLFDRTVSFDTTSYGQGVNGFTSYDAETEFSVVTTAGSGGVVSFLGVVKGQSLSQTGTGAPVLQSDSPFVFNTFVDITGPGTVTGVSVQRLPGGTVVPLNNESDEFHLEASFITRAALDAAFPNGDYRVAVHSTDGTRDATFTLTGDIYPNDPHCSNYNAAQSVNPAASFTLTWDALTGGSVTDFIRVQVETAGQGEEHTAFRTPDSPGQPGALNGTATSVTIPAGTLVAGTSYSVRLLFAKLTASNPAGFPGATAIAGYFKNTIFDLKTQGTGDTTPPSLIGSNPANGTINVPVSSTVSFTFSEPMQSAHSISWSGNVPAGNFAYTWSADQRTFTAAYNASLPANSTISWVLNPSGFGGGFRDMAGNLLPANLAGNFSTGGNPNTPNPGTWTYKPFMPAARTRPRAAIINGLLYVVGGFDSGGVSGVLEVYDPNQGIWRGLAPMPTPRGNPGVGVINGMLYVAGGAFGGTALEVYDPASNAWSTRRPMNINHGGAAGVIGNKLYVVGPSTDFTKSLEVYDPVTDTWTLKTPMPNPRSAGAAVLNGLLYTVGGDQFGTVEAYDPATDSWTSKASIPGNGNTIYDPGVAAMDGRLYVAGGYNNGTAVEIYDPVSDRWSFGSPMPSSRGDLGVAALPDKLFAVGGVDAPGQTPLPFLEQLNLHTNDAVVTLVLRSDASTSAAGMGSGVPSGAMLNRLNTDDTSGLTFQPALVVTVANGIELPTGSPPGTRMITIPAGNGQNGFFRLSFVLPPGYSGAQISCGAVMDYYGRAFLNGNPLTPAIDSSQQFPALGTIESGSGRDTFFSATNPAFFRTGTNHVDFADINANGGASAGAFYCLATYGTSAAAPTLGNPVWLSGNRFQFRLTGDPGAMYRIEANTNLANRSGWIALGTNTASGGSFLFADPAIPGLNNRSYRAVLIP